MLYHVRGRQEQAEKTLGEAAKIYRDQLPKDHPIFVVGLDADAVLQRAGGHYGDAQAEANTTA